MKYRISGIICYRLMYCKVTGRKEENWTIYFKNIFQLAKGLYTAIIRKRCDQINIYYHSTPKNKS